MKTFVMSPSPIVSEIAAILGLDPETTVGFELNAMPYEVVQLKVHQLVTLERLAEVRDCLLRHDVRAEALPQPSMFHI